MSQNHQVSVDASDARRVGVVDDQREGLPRVRLTRGCGVSGRERGLVYCLKLDRGESAESTLSAGAVIGFLDPDHVANRSSARVAQRFRSRTFFCGSAKNDSIAALSPHARPGPSNLVSR